MSEAPQADPAASQGPLSGVSVLEIGDELGSYSGRLLADLGAEVTRVLATWHDAPPVGSPERSASDWFLHRGKVTVRVDLAGAAGRGELVELLRNASVLIESAADGTSSPTGLSRMELKQLNPELIVISVTPFGREGPYASHRSTDLTRLAAGGLLWLGGYPDAEPVAPYGGQSNYAAGIFASIAALLAMIARQRDGQGRAIDVSAQETVIQALEDSIAQYDLTGHVRRRLGDSPREAGTGVYACRDGYVSMVAGRLGTAHAWERLCDWLAEEGVERANELLEPEWQSFAHRQKESSAALFATIFSSFAATRGKQELYLEAQRRSIALAPVNTIDDLLADRQLQERHFFTEILHPDATVRATFPRPPYRLSPTSAPIAGSTRRST
ncbi:MAG TPA: CoA transferase [Microbacteriaceae bacterium]|nr:CoA transferase [Microbacteriaceae bacterium]